MNILAIDTAGIECSVMLSAKDQQHASYERSDRMHSRLILQMIEGLFVQAGIQPEDIQLLAWNAGPGSFTGLRIAASVVQSLAYSFNLPVVSLSSLELQAQAACREIPAVQKEPLAISVATDAKINGVYWASFVYHQNTLERLEPDQLVSISEIEKKMGRQGGTVLKIGDGWLRAGLESAHQVGVHASIEDVILLVAKKTTTEWEYSPNCCLPNYVHDEMGWQKRKPVIVGC